MSDDWQKLKLTDPFECPTDWARGWGGRHRPWWIRSWCHFVNIRTPRNAILRFRSPPSVTIESFLYLFASQQTDIKLFFYIIVIVYRHRRGYNFVCRSCCNVWWTAFVSSIQKWTAFWHMAKYVQITPWDIVYLT